MKNNFISSLLISIIIGAISGGLVAYMLTDNNQEKSDNVLIKDFYLTENLVHVSPHHIRKAITKGNTDDFILVDLRSQQEYEEEHVIGAINISAYKDPDTSAYDDKERIINEFKKLDYSKDVIVYCYSIPCMTGRKIGKLLAENDIFVQHLGIGWNEWRYSWASWNHEHEWAVTDVMDYVESEKTQHTIDDKPIDSDCSIGGELSC